MQTSLKSLLAFVHKDVKNASLNHRTYMTAARNRESVNAGLDYWTSGLLDFFLFFIFIFIFIFLIITPNYYFLIYAR